MAPFHFLKYGEKIMQRDWDIIRKILLKIEQLPTEDSTFTSDDLENVNSSIVTYQMRLMLDAKLIEGGCRDASDDMEGT